MYFALYIENERIKCDEGGAFTAGRFRQVVESNAAKDKFLDMTLMCQRFIALDYNWQKIREFYEQS